MMRIEETTTLLLAIVAAATASIISYNISERPADFVIGGEIPPPLAATGKCPAPCICSYATVICTGKSLKTVPKGLPFDVVRLDLQENQISAIKRTDFVGLHHLKILQLMDNEIQSIENGAFDSLVALERLRLNRNRIRALPDHLFRRIERLHRLDLSENFLSVLTDEQLRGPRALLALQLDRNQLACLDIRVPAIDWADSLEVFTLNGNSLNTLGELSTMPNLRILRLSDNPWHCDCRLTWMRRGAFHKQSLIGNVKCARPAMLQGRLVASIDDQQLKCSGVEKRAATSCSDTSVCPALCVCTETTVDCHDRGLKYIPSNLLPTTTELRLEQNHITSIPRNAFQNLKKLVRLDLSKNNIEHIASGAFNGLTSLNTLMLYGNALADLPANVFTPLSGLQLLLLNTNKLACIRGSLFDGLNNLNLLSLYDNQIRSIAPGTFEDLRALQTLHLARNPLICDCNLQWLGTLLAKRAIETSGARCAAPRRLARRRLASLPAAKMSCTGSQAFVTQHAGECQIDFECPAKCFCHGTVVDCSGRELTEIPPDIPHFATELLLARNNIRKLTTKSSLHNLTALEQLDLSENKIENIEENAFDGMTTLRKLNMTANALKHFSSSMLGSAIKSISILILNDNQLQCVTSTTFGALSNLRLLSLAGNRLHSITEHTFVNMPHLHSIYLYNNNFACNCRLVDFLRYLRANATDILFDEPTCASPDALIGRSLGQLDIEQLRCKDGPQENVCAENGNYCPASCTCIDTVVRCSNQQLRSIPVGISIETTELYLDNNLINNLPRGVFRNLTQLIKLDLSHNRLSVVENDTFVTLSRLSTLILSYNRLRCLEPTAFDGLAALRILSLHANNLSTLPERTFSPLFANLSHIAMGSNPLHCDCATAWFARWIKARFIESGIAKCETPAPMHNQLLLTASASQLKCNTPLPSEIMAKCDACASTPCANGGICSPGAALTFSCACPAEFYGTRCERAIDACYGTPCLNNATCEVIQEGRFRCLCVRGFIGERCETDIDDCTDHKCQNHGQCIDRVNSYECKCPQMFAGQFCEEKLEFCTPKLNPCSNGALCQRAGSDNYTCTCVPGFVGRNCTTNVDDCAAHKCQNGGLCVDGVGRYACKCALGFAGEFCETRTAADPSANYNYYSVAALSRRRDLTSTAAAASRQRPRHCSADNCHHGHCDFSLAEELEESRNDASQHGICRCAHGYSGEDCRRQLAVGFTSRTDSYVALSAWRAAADGQRNLTFVLRTVQKTGVLMYYGRDTAFVTLELFDGRIKASFYVGNHPTSHMYSYAIVNDGRRHVVQVLIIGRELSLSIDGQGVQRVLNSGKIAKFELSDTRSLYLGGIPHRVAQIATAAFHLIDAHSLQGCLTDVYVNGVPVDFGAVTESHETTRGCVSAVDLCATADCGAYGRCAVNASLADGFQCVCAHGYAGERCEKRNVECVKEKLRDYFEESGCRSVESIKNARCVGWCGDDAPVSAPSACCTAVRAKRRRVKMHCRDGGTRVALVNIVRKCMCRNDCDAEASPAIVF